jgi:hypothetical protein
MCSCVDVLGLLRLDTSLGALVSALNLTTRIQCVVRFRHVSSV